MNEYTLRPLVVSIAAALGVSPWLAACAPAPVDPLDRTCDPDLPELTEDTTPGTVAWACVPSGGEDCALDPRAHAVFAAWLSVSEPDCGDDEFAVVCGPVSGAGAGVGASDDCCYVLENLGVGCAEGRPLRGADGVVLPVRAPADLPPLARHWAERGTHEHASVAAFARVVLQLVALGAPADLVAAHVVAQADEVRHAEVCFTLASRFAGRPVRAAALPHALAPLSAEPAALLLDTLVGGCVGETLAAARAQAAASRADDDEVREALRGIAEDEARHAALAWRTARWLLGRHPELRPLVAEALRSSEGSAGEEGEPSLGWLSSAEVARIHAATVRRVIEPAARLLLAEPASAEARA